LINRKKEAALAAIADQRPGKNPDSIALTRARRHFQHYDLISQRDNRSIFIDVDFSTWLPCMIQDEQKLYYCDLKKSGKFTF